MKITDFAPVDPTMSETRTYEHFYKFLGEKPHRLGVVARLYSEFTPLYITEAIANVIYNDSGKLNKFQSVNSMKFEWEIQTNFIKRIPFAEIPVDDGTEGGPIRMAFTENYYQMNDIFVIDDSRQQCIVVSRPVHVSDGYWEVTVRLIDNDFNSVLDKKACQKGCTTHFISNAHPELSDQGYIKYQNSTEIHRNYITTFRNDVSYSSLYAAHEQMFTTVTDTSCGVEKALVLNKAEKDLLDNFMYARSTGLLLNRSDVDVNGKPTIQDEVGRDIYIGDGLIPQIERYCNKYVYNKLTVGVLNSALVSMSQRSDTPVDNTYVFICNEKLWNDVNVRLGEWLSRFDASNALLWSKSSNGYVDVGATYQSYAISGNKIVFRPDRTISREFGNEKGYGFMIDLTPDKGSATPAVNMFTLKNGEFISSEILGVGGKNGVTSGAAATQVAGSHFVIMGYAGIGVMNPYKSFILMEA